MVDITDFQDINNELSLTPLIESAKLAIPPSALIDNPSNDGVLTLAKLHKNQNKKAQKPKSKPGFVMKLWTMLNDESNKELIDWLPDGKSILVPNRELFVQKILPKYFKHSNFASFVRQLNMYGWHKVQDANSGSLHSDEKWQFSNPNFQKGRPELLENITRNKHNEDINTEIPDTQNFSQLNVNILVEQLNILKNNQLKISQELSRVRDDNVLLWQELIQTREKNSVQNDKIEKILQFLQSVYGNKARSLEDGFFSQQQHLTDLNSNDQNYPDIEFSSTGSTPSNLNQNFNTFNPKPRLMLKQHRHESNSSSGTNRSTANILDNSPIQEIIRSPNESRVHTQGTPQYDPSDFRNTQTDNFNIAQLRQQSQTSKLNNQQQPQGSFIQPESQFRSPGIMRQQQQNQQQIHELPDIPPEEIPIPSPMNLTTLPSTPQSVQKYSRPKLSSHPSYKKLSDSIEQQGYNIDELMNKIQAQPQASSNNLEQFDIDDFLNDEFDNLEDEGDIEEIKREFSTPSLSKINDQSLYSNELGSSGVKRRDDTFDDLDNSEIGEIINPLKKKKSDQFK